MFQNRLLSAVYHLSIRQKSKYVLAQLIDGKLQPAVVPDAPTHIFTKDAVFLRPMNFVQTVHMYRVYPGIPSNRKFLNF